MPTYNVAPNYNNPRYPIVANQPGQVITCNYRTLAQRIKALAQRYGANKPRKAWALMYWGASMGNAKVLTWAIRHWYEQCLPNTVLNAIYNATGPYTVQFVNRAGAVVYSFNSSNPYISI